MKISIAKCLSSEDMFRFSDIIENQGQSKNVTEKIIRDRKEVSKNRNDNETEYTSVEDLLNIHRTSSNGTTHVYEISNIIKEENVIIALGQEKKIYLSVINFVKSKHFLIFILGMNWL